MKRTIPVAPRFPSLFRSPQATLGRATTTSRQPYASSPHPTQRRPLSSAPSPERRRESRRLPGAAAASIRHRTTSDYQRRKALPSLDDVQQSDHPIELRIKRKIQT